MSLPPPLRLRSLTAWDPFSESSSPPDSDTTNLTTASHRLAYQAPPHARWQRPRRFQGGGRAAALLRRVNLGSGPSDVRRSPVDVAYSEGLRISLTKAKRCASVLLSVEKSGKRAMLLRRSLPPPADRGVATNRHRAGLPLLRIDAIPPGSPKPPNPFGLTRFLSVRYARFDPLRTHCAYLTWFQQLMVEKRPCFRKRVMVPVFLVSDHRGRRSPDYLASVFSAHEPQFQNETWPRTKLEGGLESVACQETSEAAISYPSEKFGTVTVLHVTVPLSNVRLRPRTDSCRLRTVDFGPPGCQL